MSIHTTILCDWCGYHIEILPITKNAGLPKQWYPYPGHDEMHLCEFCHTTQDVRP